MTGCKNLRKKYMTLKSSSFDSSIMLATNNLTRACYSSLKVHAPHRNNPPYQKHKGIPDLQPLQHWGCEASAKNNSGQHNHHGGCCHMLVGDCLYVADRQRKSNCPSQA